MCSFIHLQTCLLDVLDTAGQEEYSPLRTLYARGADGFMVVYSITSRQSFDEALQIYEWSLRVSDNDHMPAVSLYTSISPVDFYESVFRGMDDVLWLILITWIALFVKNSNFASLTLGFNFLTLKMTLSHENNTRNELPGQNHKKMRYYISSPRS